MLDAAEAAANSDIMARPKVAIVLFNLGGPDSPAAVRPFLVNLFTDPAILRVPPFVRPWLARIIAYARTKPATANYALLGGKSPLLELTEQQARALEAALKDTLPELDARCFVAMRYWHPFSGAAVRAVQEWDPDQVLLLPLYPQFSTTTTGSSLTAWRAAAARAGLAKPTTALCCYHSDPGFAAATAALLRATLDGMPAAERPRARVLFSAHGLPETIVKRGDPYQFQVERTVAAVLRALREPDLDWAICYQSRATPQAWIGPSTEDEIARAARDKAPLVVVPIAFVSEHSETLVELDVEYAELAHKQGVPAYYRVPAQNSDPGFIAALAGLVRAALARGPGLCSFRGPGLCPARHRDCPHLRAGMPTRALETA